MFFSNSLLKNETRPSGCFFHRQPRAGHYEASIRHFTSVQTSQLIGWKREGIGESLSPLVEILCGRSKELSALSERKMLHPPIWGRDLTSQTSVPSKTLGRKLHSLPLIMALFRLGSMFQERVLKDSGGLQKTYFYNDPETRDQPIKVHLASNSLLTHEGAATACRLKYTSLWNFEVR